MDVKLTFPGVKKVLYCILNSAKVSHANECGIQHALAFTAKLQDVLKNLAFAIPAARPTS